MIRDHGGFDLYGDLLEVGERFMPVHLHHFPGPEFPRTVPQRGTPKPKNGRSTGLDRRRP
jgi:hypothetical protein